MTQPPVTVPGYRILRPLGVGGMASVYLAIQESLDREVALKVMSPALAANEEFTDRFLKEGRITAKLSHAPGNGAAIGGLKVQTADAWFAARPSGTEDVYKLYAESLRGPEHLAEVQAEARAVVTEALGGA